MSINLDKNQRELISSWKEVVDEKCDTSWAVYGYEKQSDCLELVAKGDGLEELADQFSISRIMYAFCRYKSVNSDLPKFFIINWQGEGAQPARKMVCANHINDVAKFFRGSNMTIEARNEDDVEPTSIIKKLERISIHSFNIKERSIVENVSPVGTNYKRIQPQKEIDIHKRETFWSKVQEEETKRRLEEKKRLEEERLAREKILVERQLDEAQEEKITIITESKRELTTDKDIKKELERSKLGVRGKADNQWIRVKDEEKEKGESIASNGTNNGETVKCTNLVKSRVESFKKAFEGGGKPPSLPKKTFLDIKKIKNDTVTSSASNDFQEKSQVPSKAVNNEELDAKSPIGKVASESSLGPVVSKKELANDIGKDIVTQEEVVKLVETVNETNTGAPNNVEVQVVEDNVKATTMDNQAVAKIEANNTEAETEAETIPKVTCPIESEEMLNEEAKVPPSPSPEPGLEQIDDANDREGHLNAEIYETEEELNDKQSEDILNAEELEDEEYDVNKSIEWTSNSRAFPAGDLESDENHYFTVKSSYLDTLEDIAEEAEENIEEEEDEKENGEEPTEDGEKEEDELECERKFLQEIEKKFPKSEYGLKARALYDYQAADETEITFDPDDIITHIEQVDVGWWQGMAPDGTYGLFPANYVQLIE